MSHNSVSENPRWGRFQSIRRAYHADGRCVEIHLTDGTMFRISDDEAAFLVFLLPDHVPGLCVPPHIMEMTNPDG